jgi:phage anti-repressor protein
MNEENSPITPLGKIAAVIKSESRFPIDFDEAWEWIGYSSKQKAKEALERNFEQGTDFTSFNRTVKREIGATSKTQINLTVDCFKAFCMMAGTEKGKEVRRYYIDLEKRYCTKDIRGKSVEARHKITDEWQRQGVSKPAEYGGLTRMEYYCLFGDPNLKKADMDKKQTLALFAMEAVEAMKLAEIPEKALGYHGCELSLSNTAALLEAVKAQNKRLEAVHP